MQKVKNGYLFINSLKAFKIMAKFFFYLSFYSSFCFAVYNILLRLLLRILIRFHLLNSEIKSFWLSF